MIAVPKQAIERIVGAFHVGTDPDIIAQDIRKRCRKNIRCTESIERRCVAYALKAHAANLKLYGHVMGGF